jgi:hypothetical protein
MVVGDETLTHCMAAFVPVKIPIFWYLSSLVNRSLARVMKAPLKYSRPNL